MKRTVTMLIKEKDYYAKFAITPIIENQPTTASPQEESEKAPEKSASTYFCYKCKRTISSKAAFFCFQHKARFGGKAYCFDCQKAF